MFVQIASTLPPPLHIPLFIGITDAVEATQKRLSQNKLEMASIASSQIGFIRIFLKREVYKLSFEDFILSNCFSRCHKPPKRLLLQDYVL